MLIISCSDHKKDGMATRVEPFPVILQSNASWKVSPVSLHDLYGDTRHIIFVGLNTTSGTENIPGRSVQKPAKDFPSEIKIVSFLWHFSEMTVVKAENNV